MSFDVDPSDDAHISGADFARMCDEMRELRQKLNAVTAERDALLAASGQPSPCPPPAFIDQLADEPKRVSLHDAAVRLSQQIPTQYRIAVMAGVADIVVLLHDQKNTPGQYLPFYFEGYPVEYREGSEASLYLQFGQDASTAASSS